MKITLAFVPVALLLAGCATDAMWSEAPGTARYGGTYGSGYAPVGWWGSTAPGLDAFYGPLSAYGRWVQYPAYGMVFLPSGLASGWMPYSNGYWAGSGAARNWVSSEPFGWATSHYGRWADDPRLGWFWVPDTRFSSAWVDWRETGGRASWTPLPPAGWQGRSADRRWLSAPSAYLGRSDLRRHIQQTRPATLSAGNRQPARTVQPATTRPAIVRPSATRPSATRPAAVSSSSARQPSVRQSASTPGNRPARQVRGQRPPRTATTPRTTTATRTTAPRNVAAGTAGQQPADGHTIRTRPSRSQARAPDSRRNSQPERVRQSNRQTGEARQHARTQPRATTPSRAGQRSWQAHSPRSPRSSAPSTSGRRR